ncbi:MAG: esterase/lipase family protein [Paracoccaceae bacterium]
MPRISGLALLFVTVGLMGCSQEARLPDLKQIYQKASSVDDRVGSQRRPLVAIPGTLGSRLVDSASGKIIWGGSGSRGISADPEDPEEYALIALPIAKADEPFADLVDTVVPGGILETAEAEILGVPISINVYGDALGVLSDGGFRVQRGIRRFQAGGDPDAVLDDVPEAARLPNPVEPAVEVTDFDTFQFDYDWRRDLIDSAHKFGHFLEKRRRDVARTQNKPEGSVKFDLLAHSMGTLVSRYFLMYGFADPAPGEPLPPITWAGADYFSRVVFVAPPNSGSVIALDNLINGKELGPLQPVFPPALLGTHVSPYQLMPRVRHRRVMRDGAPVIDLYDVDFWEEMGWGLLNPAAEAELALMMPDEPSPERRRSRARAYTKRLLARSETFHKMMDRWTPPPEHLDLFLVVGGGFETPATAEIDPVGTFRITGLEEGDGVVLRASALADERQDGNSSTGFRSPLRYKTTLFLPDEHVELTRNRVFGDNLLFWLLEAPRGGSELARPNKTGFLGNVSDGPTQAADTEGGFLPGNDDR